jgi:hypothetical protein
MRLYDDCLSFSCALSISEAEAKGETWGTKTISTLMLLILIHLSITKLLQG